MRIKWYQAPILAIAALASWIINLFSKKSLKLNQEHDKIGKSIDTEMADAVDSTYGFKKK